MERYAVFKSTGTHSDVIAAVGAADVLRELEPRLVDCGDRFEVQLRRPMVPDDLIGNDPGFLYLPKPGKRPAKVPDDWVFEAVPARPGISGSKRGVDRSFVETVVPPGVRNFGFGFVHYAR